MHAVLVSMGTDGDVFPYLGLGRRLRARGWRVSLLANENYQPAAAALGFEFHAIVTQQEMDRALADPDFWHPLRGTLTGLRLALTLLPRQYKLVAEVAADPEAVIVGSVGVLAARLAGEKLGRPHASMVLQPWMIVSTCAPPRMPGGLSLPRGMPRLLGRIYWRLVDAAGALLLGGPLNRLRAELGLPAVSRIFPWWISPQLVLGMFPEWYGPPQPDWPVQIRLAGFPRYDGLADGRLPADLAAFCREGTAPVAFTLGTGMMHASTFFQSAVDSCARMGIRAVLLTKYPDLLPRPLPPRVYHCTFAPFGELFPRCAAVVHHGGVGTVAQALAAGTPQLILPLAWDQPDNAVRVKQLGAGEWLGRGRRSASAIAAALARLTTPHVQARCRAVAAAFSPADPFDVAANWVVQLAGR